MQQLCITEQDSTTQAMTSIIYLVARILAKLIWKQEFLDECDRIGDCATVSTLTLPSLCVNSDKTSNNCYRDCMGLSINIRSHGLPMGAGLGSSAALSVAVAASCLRLYGMLYPSESNSLYFANNTSYTNITIANATIDAIRPTNELLHVINAWAYASEILLHGSPSGLDNTTSCYGGFVKFSRGRSPSTASTGQPPSLSSLSSQQQPSSSSPSSFEMLPTTQAALQHTSWMIVNTKIPRSTKKLVAAVRVLYDSYPEVIQPIIDSIDQIANKFVALLAK